MILDAIFEYLLLPIFSILTDIFPTFLFGWLPQFTPYIVSTASFLSSLFSYIGYFIPLELLFLIIVSKLAFYIARFTVRIVKMIIPFF